MLVLSSCLYYLALIPLIYAPSVNRTSRLNRIYENTILCATFASIMWHSYPSSIILCLINYAFAGLWFALDYLWSKALNKKIIIELNALVFLAFIMSTFVPNYDVAHTVWHVISASKCFYVSLLIYMHDS
jgi:hypothetical protein